MRNKFTCSQESGFTLIELLVTIALVAIIISVVAVNIAGIIRVDLSAEAGRVASVIRYLHATSVIQNRPCRLVVDLGGGTYTAECFDPALSQTMFLLDPERNEENLNLEKKKDYTKGNKKLEEVEEGVAKKQPFTPLQTTMMKESTFKLPKGIQFKKVMTIHQDEPVFDRAEIYFFPNGFVEKSYIYIGLQGKDEEGEEEKNIKTISVEPLSGKVPVYTEERDYKEVISGD